MPRVVLASSLARWCSAAPSGPSEERSVTVTGATVREALESVFAEFPMLRDYVLDERQALRHHVMLVVGSEIVHDKQKLSTPLSEDDELYVLQALSGG